MWCYFYVNLFVEQSDEDSESIAMKRKIEEVLNQCGKEYWLLENNRIPGLLDLPSPIGSPAKPSHVVSEKYFDSRSDSNITKVSYVIWIHNALRLFLNITTDLCQLNFDMVLDESYELTSFFRRGDILFCIFIEINEITLSIIVYASIFARM